jgi:hypothetical protein
VERQLRSFAPGVRQSREGRRGEGRAIPSGENTLEGQNPMRATRFPTGLNRLRQWRILTWSKALKASVFVGPSLFMAMLSLAAMWFVMVLS